MMQLSDTLIQSDLHGANAESCSWTHLVGVSLTRTPLSYRATTGITPLHQTVGR